MKRIFTDSQNYKVLRLLDEYTSAKNISIADGTKDDDFLSFISQTINTHRAKRSLVHGLRTQSLFAYMAASLGRCVHISEEDIGDYYSKESKITRPDFRVILDNGDKLFIEVKNYFQTNPKNSFKITKKYLQSLLAYANLHGLNLKIAIYWTKWRMWTLIDPKYLELKGEDYYLNLINACEKNEMNILGDCLIATVPPLSIKFETETIEKHGKNLITIKIKKAYLLANGKKIKDKTESRIASFLLFNCRWNRIEQPAEMENEQLKSFEIQAFPDEERMNPDCDFQMMGNLSEMLTNQYNLMTTDDGKVKAITSLKQPINIRKMIPDNFKGHHFSNVAQNFCVE